MVKKTKARETDTFKILKIPCKWQSWNQNTVSDSEFWTLIAF